MKKLAFFIFFIFLLMNLVYAQEISLTLDEAIAIGLRDNPNILLGKEEINKAKQILSQSYSALFPNLNLGLSWQNTKELYPKDITSFNTQLSLTQVLYQGGRIINTISLSKDRILLTETILDKTKLELILAIKKAFYSLLLQERLVELSRKILENIQAHLEAQKKRYKYGEVSESEILNIESSLSNAKKSYQEAINQRDSLEAVLKNLLFLKEEVSIKPKGEFIYEPKEIAYDTAFLEALSKRPEIKEYELKEKMAKKQVQITRSLNRPNIFASWNYYSSSRTSLGTVSQKGWQDYQTFGIVVQWPIFDGMLTQHKINEALVDLKQTQILKEKTKKDIILELKETYLSLKDAIANLRKTEAELLLYQDNLSVAEEKYKKGEISWLDKEDAQLKYEISLFNKQTAIYEYILAKASFEKAQGGM